MEEKITNYSFTILSLYRIDYTTSVHTRAMAKKLSVSHVTLLPHLRRLEKAKILLSRRVGKNKEYLLNPNNSLTKRYLEITEELATIDYLDKNFLIKRISDQLSTMDLIGSLLLFGSYTKDYSTEASDIDIFHLGRLEQDQQSQIKKFGKTYGKEINIKTSSIENFHSGLRTGDTLIREIVENHIILQNPSPFVNLIWRNYSER
jgi:predicted nucleotidyltransferase